MSKTTTDLRSRVLALVVVDPERHHGLSVDIDALRAAPEPEATLAGRAMQLRGARPDLSPGAAVDLALAEGL